MQKLSNRVPGDCLLPGNNNPYWSTFRGEDSSVIFYVPQVNGRKLKTVLLCIVYSSSPNNVTSEGPIVKNLFIINHTKTTLKLVTKQHTAAVHHLSHLVFHERIVRHSTALSRSVLCSVVSSVQSHPPFCRRSQQSSVSSSISRRSPIAGFMSRAVTDIASCRHILFQPPPSLPPVILPVAGSASFRQLSPVVLRLPPAASLLLPSCESDKTKFTDADGKPRTYADLVMRGNAAEFENSTDEDSSSDSEDDEMTEEWKCWR
ncbi:hypothetical protein PIB30_001776 [Stylosanthes scabra]|uniref:Uncharacterized protein n=1 Tax=Stylosanthes scabra TaxID=79078 RepID=A0ABU6V2K6_9FABA|nr:hypothetical protein [Stylosanthes scabra]